MVRWVPKRSRATAVLTLRPRYGRSGSPIESVVNLPSFHSRECARKVDIMVSQGVDWMGRGVRDKVSDVLRQ